MQIIVKVLRGKEWTFQDLSSEMTIKEIKEKLCYGLNISINEQKLLFGGKPLADDKRLCDYPLIKDGAKLNLVIIKPDIQFNKETDEVMNSQSPEECCSVLQFNTVERHDCETTEQVTLKDVIWKYLKKHPIKSPDRVTNAFIRDVSSSLSTLNYDDIEKLAATLLLEEEDELRNEEKKEETCGDTQRDELC